MRTMVSRRKQEAWTFMAPLLAVVTAFILLPVISTLVNSFWQDVTFLPGKFVFLKHYLRLAKDPGFWQAARFTVWFTLVSVPLQLVLGLLFAWMMNEPAKYRSLLRIVILIPWIIPSAVSARVWELIFHYHHGLANYILQSAGLVRTPVNWFETPWLALGSLVLADTWKMTPLVALLLLAGLAAIPKELSEQAQVDGANLRQRFFLVTLPLLRPVMMVALLFRTIDALRVFDLIYVLSQGGPGGSTTSLSLYSYTFFLNGDFGYGSAVSVALFVISLGLSIIYVKAGKFQEALP